MLRSDFCDYTDSFIVVNDTIDLLVATANENDKAQKNVAFRSRISKINNTLKGNGEALDIVNLMYNLLEYSDNYSIT